MAVRVLSARVLMMLPWFLSGHLACSEENSAPAESGDGDGDGPGEGTGGRGLGGEPSTGGMAGSRSNDDGPNTGAAVGYSGWDVVAASGKRRLVLAGASSGDVVRLVRMQRGVVQAFETDLTGERPWTMTHAIDDLELPDNAFFRQAQATGVHVAPEHGVTYLRVESNTPLLGWDGDDDADVDPYVLKMDDTGQLAWILAHEHEEGLPLGVLSGVDRDAAFYSLSAGDSVGGGFERRSLFQLVKSTADGEVEWVVRNIDLFSTFLDEYPDYSDSGGRGRTTGTFATTTESGTTYLWGSYYLGLPPDDFNYFWVVAKVDPRGELVWQRMVVQRECEGGTLEDQGSISALAVAPDDSAVYAFGDCLAKLDAEGELEWSKAHGLFEDIGLNRLSAAPRERSVVSFDGESIYVVAAVEGGGLADQQMICFDSDGDMVWHIEDALSATTLTAGREEDAAYITGHPTLTSSALFRISRDNQEFEQLKP